jgi:hypothetical protein
MTFPGVPRVLKGGVALVDLDTSEVKRIVVFQYNPDTLTRSLQTQGAGNDTSDHMEVLRLKGPPVETIKLDAELDATDRLEHPDQNQFTVDNGLHAQLAALETILYPESDDVLDNYYQSFMGSLEILPLTAPLQVFIWGQRIVPVRITDISITEEAFDTALNPIRAKVSLTMRVLNNNDLGFDNKGGSLFINHHQRLETLAKKVAGDLPTLGLTKL